MTQELSEQEVRDYGATIEAVLFMYGTPIKFTKLSEIVELSKKDTQLCVESLVGSYEERAAGLRISVHGDAVQMVTEKSQSEIIEKFTRKELEGDLSQAALEVLAIIAYRGPLSKPDVESIRGVNCSFTLRNLLLRGLIDRSPHPTDSRTKIYDVTHDFLRHLGMGSREELPHFEKLVGDRRIDAVLYGLNEEEVDED